jgi:WS/DGAT/MGAT family acyltransferase
MARAYLSNVDLAWLRMDDPNNRMVITGFITFASPLSADHLKRVIAKNLLKFERFSQRLVISTLPLRRPYWQDVRELNLDDHVETIRLLPPSGENELKDFISALMSVPLDQDRPLWKIYLVEKYQGGSAIIARLHHAIADGIALMYVLLSMASEDPQSPLPPAITGPIKIRRDHAAHHTISSDFVEAAKSTIDLVERVNDEVTRILSDSHYARHQARLGARATAAFARLVLRLPDPPTLFKGTPRFTKRAAWSAPLSLDQVKVTGKALNATINDILLASVTGALRRYIQRRGRRAEGLNIRSLIPVNLRPLDLAGDLGNRFGLVFLSLPLGIEDPLERLAELKYRMDALKSTPEAAVALGVLGILGTIPERIQDVAVQIFDLKGTAVMTNVPGPRQQLYLAGAPIDTVMAWVPQSGRISLGVSIISYHGNVWLGVATDQALVPDPETIVQFFMDEFSSLVELAANQAVLPLRSTAEMLAALDKALATLDEIRAEKLPTFEEMTHCAATTRDDQPCKNRPLPGTAYCRVHTRKS